MIYIISTITMRLGVKVGWLLLKLMLVWRKILRRKIHINILYFNIAAAGDTIFLLARAFRITEYKTTSKN